MNKVTIVTPSYNSFLFINDVVFSVQQQSYSFWELIIVDDCSVDNSVELIREIIKKDARIKLIQLEKNSGAAVARNAAIKAASGRFIAFLDSDDLWCADKLEKQVRFMLDNDYSFTYTAYEKIDEASVPYEVMGVPVKISYHQLLKTNVIGCLTAMYDTDKLGKIYMPTNTKREDFATWLSILKKVDYAYGMQNVLAQYRVYNSQSSSKKAEMAQENWRLYREVEQLSLLQSLYYFSNYAARAVLRTKFPYIARLIGVLH